MGNNCFANFKRKICIKKLRDREREIIIAMLGVDGSGKTTVIKALKGESLNEIMPTVGFNRFELKRRKSTIVVYDLGGEPTIRDIWNNYLAEIYGIIYVMDASNKHRITENKKLFLKTIQHPQMRGKPILLLLNKQDNEGAMDELQAAEKLNLANVVNYYKSSCRIETCIATKGTGRQADIPIRQGFHWLLLQIDSKFTDLNVRIFKAVANLKTRQNREKQERIERFLRTKREEKQDDGVAPEIVDNQTNNKTVENVRHFRNKVLPFEPLPSINEEKDFHKSSLISSSDANHCKATRVINIVPTMNSIHLPALNSCSSRQTSGSSVGSLIPSSRFHDSCQRKRKRKHQQLGRVQNQISPTFERNRTEPTNLKDDNCESKLKETVDGMNGICRVAE